MIEYLKSTVEGAILACVGSKGDTLVYALVFCFVLYWTIKLLSEWHLKRKQRIYDREMQDRIKKWEEYE
jgi:hypothetical protein